jgi:uncharacterized protein YbaR (Trm112 family)
MRIKERVAILLACPRCHNRVMDKLIIQDDETVLCTHCKTIYDVKSIAVPK